MSCFCWETRVYRINRVEVNPDYGESLHVRLPCSLNSHGWPVFLETLPRFSLCELVQMACWSQACLNSHWLFLNLFDLSRASDRREQIKEVPREGWARGYRPAEPAQHSQLLAAHIIGHFPEWEKKGSHVCQWAEGNCLMYKEQQALCSPLFALGFLLFVLNLACQRLSAAPPPWGHAQTCQVLGVGAEQQGRFDEKSAARGSGGAQAAFSWTLCL